MPQGSLIVSSQANVPELYPDRIDKQFYQERGLFGALYINDTATYTNPQGWCEIHAVGVASIDTLVGSIKGALLETGGDTMPLPAGDSIRGVFTKIKLASGKVILYEAAPIGIKVNQPL